MDAKQKRIFIIFVSALLLAALALGASLARRAKHYGHISVYVIDAYTLEPLENAAIVLPESGICAETDARGVALLYSVPIDMKSDFMLLTGAAYGEITLLAYADGYLPCVWLKVHMSPGRVCNGPTIYMFPEGRESVDVTVFTQAPDEELMRRFVEKYAPPR
ncbi:MAG TPA: hypothetical protein PK438_07805 [Clostridia bacterium]|nr:hypothetical protein [Clostridia bacterium]HOS19178.1 hypothetical protein [Clostridia bacterium]HPK14921.1 hypothetical protein [Clostridia bacterium]